VIIENTDAALKAFQPREIVLNCRSGTGRTFGPAGQGVPIDIE